MGFRAYNVATTRYLCNHPKVSTKKELFATAAAARAAITREHNRGAIHAASFAVAESFVFHAEIEKKETVTTHGNGVNPTAPYEIAVNTPIGCDPRSETYWSM